MRRAKDGFRRGGCGMANMGCGRGGFFYGFMVVELKVVVIVVEGGWGFYYGSYVGS